MRTSTEPCPNGPRFRRDNRLSAVFPVIVILVLAFATPVWADSALEIELTLDRAEIQLGRQASLRISVSGPSGFSEPSVPEIEGLKVLPRGRTQSVQIINMKVKSSKVFGYAVEPQKAGEFTIGPVHIERRGKTYSSNTVKLKVVESKQAPRGAAPKGIIAEAAVDNPNPYIGQQITLLFRFARRAGVRIGNAGYQLPELNGFWNEGKESKREYRRMIGDAEYLVTEVAFPLFPVEEGKIEIGGIQFHYNELIPNERSRSPLPNDSFGGRLGGDRFFDNFFRTERAAPRTARTAPIEIDVRSLPLDGRPEEFKGGVGSFSIEADISDGEVKEGESVTLTVVLSGQGNIRDVGDPNFEIEGVKTYSDTPSISIKSYNDKIVGEKTYKVALVPQRSDSIMIPGISTPYFNPETERYETASSKSIKLGVLASDKEELELTRIRLTKPDARRDILPIHERYGSIEGGRLAALWPRLRLVAYPLPVLVYAVCFAVAGRRERLKTDIEYRRRKLASKGAASRLDGAVRAAGRKDWDKVFTGCSRAVTEFLADKLNVPPGGMTPSDVGDILLEKGVPKDFAAEIVRFLEACDYGRFASPAESPGAAEKCIAGARKILSRLKREETIR